jgi:NADH-quinone oxidoreductase subunit L
VLATVGGLVQTRALGFGPQLVQDFLAPASAYAAVGRQAWEGGGAEIAVTFVTMILATLLFLAAYRFYVDRAWRPWSTAVPWAQRLLERKYYFDEIYDAAFVRPMDALANLGLRDFEQPVIGGAIVGTGEVAEASASGLSLTQSGYFRNYVLVFVGGAVVAAVVILVRASS